VRDVPEAEWPLTDANANKYLGSYACGQRCPECGSGYWILSEDDPEQVFVKLCQDCHWVWDLEEMWHTCDGGDDDET
jgi:hypothetical protein